MCFRHALPYLLALAVFIACSTPEPPVGPEISSHAGKATTAVDTVTVINICGPRQNS